MKEIPRFEFSYCDDGMWCKSSDVEQLEAINAELLEALEYITSVKGHIPRQSDALFMAIEVAKHAIAKAEGE